MNTKNFTQLLDSRRKFLEGLTGNQIREAAKILEPCSFYEDEGTGILLEDLNAGRIEDPNKYYGARTALIRGGCVDGYINLLNENDEPGIFLITRNGEPAKGFLWPIGGAKPRNIVDDKEGLKNVARRELGENLKLEDIVFIGGVNAGWGTTPYEVDYGGKGLHDQGNAYYAKGIGKFQLTNLEKNPSIITKNMWISRNNDPILSNLHCYVEENVIKAMALLKDYC